ncbi:hypothetical protein L484_024016 [Morus notabilis]|uniref:Uncharacterized protein n=1 Tax=Morus notabilis TaxID=981085 RepID=W9RPV4_9ROSA|nr:hypothetical protein L484_024016 [Morus notabilis]
MTGLARSSLRTRLRPRELSGMGHPKFDQITVENMVQDLIWDLGIGKVTLLRFISRFFQGTRFFKGQNLNASKT